MAVRLDSSALLDSVGTSLSAQGREHLAHERVRDVAARDGGVTAVVDDPELGPVEVWVGVISGVLTGECDCGAAELCGHSVAATLAALELGLAFSSMTSRASEEIGEDQRRFAQIAARLAPDKLIGLVARQAAADRYFAALLLACAGQLPPAGPAELDGVRRVIAAAADVPNGRRWELRDLVDAGEQLTAELELLAIRPPTGEMLTVVEEAMQVWAQLCGHLHEGPHIEEQVSHRLADLHLHLAAELQPDPLELAARLARLAAAGAEVSIDDYADLLGPDELAEFDRQRPAAWS
ncbi:MAG TPA: hypothetical protein VFM37_17335 [Pseudonocardiaceae bacterium]|nr:hypothetical protein [Pseudonocardiaceae bacterium]